jgi:hypothetical protein
LKSHQLQHDCHAARVIAQQYSSATFVSLHFHSRKEKFNARLKNLLFYFFYFFKLRKNDADVACGEWYLLFTERRFRQFRLHGAK